MIHLNFDLYSFWNIFDLFFFRILWYFLIHVFLLSILTLRCIFIVSCFILFLYENYSSGLITFFSYSLSSLPCQEGGCISKSWSPSCVTRTLAPQRCLQSWCTSQWPQGPKVVWLHLLIEDSVHLLEHCIDECILMSIVHEQLCAVIKLFPRCSSCRRWTSVTKSLSS